jgi:phage baseplate assembly protein gpV
MSNKTENTVKGNRKPSSGNSAYNAIDFMIQNHLQANVNTAALGQAGGGDSPGPTGAAGKLSAKPMVSQVDNFGQAMPQASAAGMPFFRLQAGKCAIVMDPQGGDKGLIVYTKADSSGVENQGDVPPASNRTFSSGNGFFFSGFSNSAPEVYVELNQAGQINIHGKTDMLIDTEGTITIKAAKIVIDGPIETTSSLTISGGQLKTDTATFDTHTHTGDSGGSTSSPNSGS